MSSFSILFAAASLASPTQAAVPVDSVDATARISFVSDYPQFLGSAFGLDAIDGERTFVGERLTADVGAGQRTVWYSCPDMPTSRDGARITFDFEAGHSYSLVCQGDHDAVIRQTDGC